jgi:hypothetical protein
MKAKYEIEIRAGQWVEVDNSIFRSWGGKRKLNGEEYNGDVYYLWSNEVYKKPC